MPRLLLGVVLPFFFGVIGFTGYFHFVLHTAISSRYQKNCFIAHSLEFISFCAFPSCARTFFAPVLIGFVIHSVGFCSINICSAKLSCACRESTTTDLANGSAIFFGVEYILFFSASQDTFHPFSMSQASIFHERSS